jgi:hypothetical protein
MNAFNSNKIICRKMLSPVSDIYHTGRRVFTCSCNYPEIKSGKCIALFLAVNPEDLVFSGSSLTSAFAAFLTGCFPSRFTAFL